MHIKQNLHVIKTYDPNRIFSSKKDKIIGS